MPSNARPHIYLRCRSEEWKNYVREGEAVIRSLVKCSELQVLGPEDADPQGCLKNHVNDEIQTYIKVVGLIDIKLELERIKKRQNELTRLMEGQKKKMSIPNYEAKVPESVRNENSDKYNGYELEHQANENGQKELAQFL